MSETVTQDVVVEDTERAEEEPILEPLIEEVSIDGMCGVY